MNYLADFIALDKGSITVIELFSVRISAYSHIFYERVDVFAAPAFLRFRA